MEKMENPFLTIDEISDISEDNFLLLIARSAINKERLITDDKELRVPEATC